MVKLESLRRLSARIGADPLLVQAAGGNTSIKQDGVMWIKASGTWLRDAVIKDIFVSVDHPSLMAALARNDPACETCTAFVSGESSLRPSIETTVHALMPQRVVLHVHCVNTIAWAILKNAESAMREKLDGFNWAFIPYARPGLPLAKAIMERLKPGIDVLVLGNHGLVVAAGTMAEAEALLNRVVAALHRPARAAIAARFKASHADYAPASSPETHSLATDRLALVLGKEAVFYPDHVVFLGVGVATSFDGAPPLVALPGQGVFIHKQAKPAVEPMARCLADVMRRIGENDDLLPLSAEDIHRLLNWDAEKYRSSLP